MKHLKYTVYWIWLSSVHSLLCNVVKFFVETREKKRKKNVTDFKGSATSHPCQTCHAVATSHENNIPVKYICVYTTFSINAWTLCACTTHSIALWIQLFSQLIIFLICFPLLSCRTFLSLLLTWITNNLCFPVLLN